MVPDGRRGVHKWARSQLEQEVEEEPAEEQERFPERRELGMTPFPHELVAGNLAYPVAAAQTSHHHVLLDVEIVRGKAEIQGDVAANRSKPVEHVGQSHVPPVVDRDRDDAAPHVTQEVGEVTVEFITSAEN